MDCERQDHAAGNVALGIDRFRAERGRRFKADQDQDRDRGLEQQTRKIVRQDNRSRDGMIPTIHRNTQRILNTEQDCQHTKDDERGQLNHVNDDACRRRTVDAAHRDETDERREYPRDGDLDPHRDCQAELSQDVRDQDCHERDHHAGVDPVKQVRRPTGDELGDARPASVRRLFAVQECFFGKVVRTATACVRIAVREFGERERGQKRDDQRGDDARPHVHRRARSARIHVRGLELERHPQECARRDQRHRIHRDPGQAECLFHARALASLCRHFLLLKKCNQLQ